MGADVRILIDPVAGTGPDQMAGRECLQGRLTEDARSKTGCLLRRSNGATMSGIPGQLPKVPLMQPELIGNLAQDALALIFATQKRHCSRL